jgi:dihydroorotate dehydrogenase (NAD+) catalytic subunit
MGGVASGRDVLELIAVGATDVALGTVLFADPGAPSRVRAELSLALANAGFDNAAEAFCAAQEPVFT